MQYVVLTVTVVCLLLMFFGGIAWCHEEEQRMLNERFDQAKRKGRQ